MNKTAIMFIADGFEEVEGLTVVDLLRRGGIKTDMASIMGRKEIKGSHDINLVTDILAENADMSSYEMVILPGGMPGTKYLGESKLVTDTVKKFAAEGKYIAAICAAPTVFGSLGLLNGKRACCYGGMEDGLTSALVSYDDVTVDGNIITSRGVGTAVDFGLKLVEVFDGKEFADDLADKIMRNPNWSRT